jgi:hypothetical protein
VAPNPPHPHFTPPTTRRFRDTGGVADEDEEALTWAGGRDPSHFETPVVKQPKPGKAAKAASAGGGSGGDAGDDDEDADLPPVTSAALLVTLGILAGVYLLYTIGWIVSLQRLYYLPTNALDESAFAAQQYLAIAAPVVWFASVLYLTRRGKPLVRLLWLIAGALLLVPWSFVFGS